MRDSSLSISGLFILLAIVVSLNIVIASQKSTSPAVGSCKRPWIRLSNNTCIFRPLNRIWSDSQAACRRVNGTLFTFRNAEEVRIVKEFADKRNWWFWVGHYYRGYQATSTAGAGSYNPPRSLYWREGDRYWYNECSLVSSYGDLVALRCSMLFRPLCQRPAM